MLSKRPSRQMEISPSSRIITSCPGDRPVKMRELVSKIRKICKISVLYLYNI